jgi:cell envelope opacity-associated protein A
LARSIDSFTAVESNGRPVWNFTPGRRLNVQVNASGVLDQVVASDGSILFSAALNVVRVS